MRTIKNTFFSLSLLCMQTSFVSAGEIDIGSVYEIIEAKETPSQKTSQPPKGAIAKAATTRERSSSVDSSNSYVHIADPAQSPRERSSSTDSSGGNESPTIINDYFPAEKTTNPTIQRGATTQTSGKPTETAIHSQSFSSFVAPNSGIKVAANPSDRTTDIEKQIDILLKEAEFKRTQRSTIPETPATQAEINRLLKEAEFNRTQKTTSSETSTTDLQFPRARSLSTDSLNSEYVNIPEPEPADTLSTDSSYVFVEKRAQSPRARSLSTDSTSASDYVLIDNPSDTLSTDNSYVFVEKRAKTPPLASDSISLSKDIHNKIMNSQLEHYPTKIKSLLNKSLGSDLPSLAKASEAITVQFEYLKDSFIKNGYPIQDVAIANMKVLLATTDGTPLTQDQLISDMKILNSFLTSPDSFDPENKAIINDLLKNMKSKLTLGSINAKQISSALAPFKDILKIALPETNTASKSLFTKAQPVAGSPEEFAPKYIESVLQLKDGRTRIDESWPVLKQETTTLKDSCTIFTQGLSDQLSNRRLSKDQVAQVLNSLIRSNKGIYDLSNPDAKQQLMSDLTTLKTFIGTPTFIEDSNSNQIINNILRNLKIDLTLTSKNMSVIRDSLKPLEPMINISLDSLKAQIASPAQALPKPNPTSSDPRLTNAEPATPQEIFAKTKLDVILATKAYQAPMAETSSISKTSQQLAQIALPQDQAISLMNYLLASPDGRYNLSQPKAQSDLQLDIKYVKSFIDTPTAPKEGGEDVTLIIDDLLHNIGSSLTVTAENFTDVAKALSPLQDLINDALGKPNTRKPAPAKPQAPSTLASLFG